LITNQGFQNDPVEKQTNRQFIKKGPSTGLSRIGQPHDAGPRRSEFPIGNIRVPVWHNRQFWNVCVDFFSGISVKVNHVKNAYIV